MDWNWKKGVFNLKYHSPFSLAYSSHHNDIVQLFYQRGLVTQKMLLDIDNGQK